MDFRLSEDQEALRDGIRVLCRGRFPLESLRKAEGASRTASAEDWAELGSAGVFGLCVPEADGGVGLGLADAAVVFEELGAALIPGPLVATFLAAGMVDGAIDGTAAAQVVSPPAVPGAIPLVAAHLEMAEHLIVLPPMMDRGAPATVIATAGLSTRPVERSLDPLTPLWVLDAAEVGKLGAAGETVDASPEVLRRNGAVLTAALQVGIASSVIGLAVEYAKGRKQFGRPIGSFQAIKHLCADMLVRAEVARSAVHAAAVLVDQPDAAAAEAQAAGVSAAQLVDRAVAGAKLLADEAALINTRSCIQVHGGMGFTWEVPAHLYLKRARVLATELGSAAEMAETVAALS